MIDRVLPDRSPWSWIGEPRHVIAVETAVPVCPQCEHTMSWLLTVLDGELPTTVCGNALVAMLFATCRGCGAVATDHVVD